MLGLFIHTCEHLQPLTNSAPCLFAAFGEVFDHFSSFRPRRSAQRAACDPPGSGAITGLLTLIEKRLRFNSKKTLFLLRRAARGSVLRRCCSVHHGCGRSCVNSAARRPLPATAGEARRFVFLFSYYFVFCPSV